MADPRHAKLARILVNYSVGLRKGDKVVIESVDNLLCKVRPAVGAKPPPPAPETEKEEPPPEE